MQKATQLEWLLSYEQRLAERYRYFLSLVMMSPDNEKAEVMKILESTIRSCDEVFTINGDYIVLMPHTSKQEARVAVNRYKSMYNGELDIRYSITSFPGDINSLSNPTEVGKQRLETAKRGKRDEVISHG